MKQRIKRNKKRKAQREHDITLDDITFFQGCILCDEPTDNTCLFIPDDQAAYGAIPGKTRTFAYALCDECFGKGLRPETMAKIEQKINAHWQAAFTRKVWSQDRETGSWKRTIYGRGPLPGMN